MNRYTRIVANTFILSITSILFAQMTVSGTVTDAATGSALAGANVIVDGTSLGAAADANGGYTLSNVPNGATITASMIGYTDASATAESTVNLRLTKSAIQMTGLDVIAPRAKLRETPVAFSDVTKEDIKLRVASQDLNMILNETPGVYASQQGGGAGDSKVNVRGFDQRNTAILINGVPVNDMENGWVYWSNWDGMADVTSSIQIQRGLGASNLAIASVGGTINVQTSAADNEKGYNFKQELGSENFYKSTLTYNTGRMNNGYAFSALLQRKTGDGWVDATWTDAYAYFLTGSKSFGDHAIDFTLLGAPQQHGQRDGDNLRPETGEKGSSAGWNIYDEAKTEYGAEDTRQINTGFNGYWDNTGSGWGYIDQANKDAIKMGTDESLDGISNMLFGGIQHTKQIGDKWIINNRTNYYHKPVYNINHSWKINNQMSLSTVLYGSNGRGGGTGPLNSRGKIYYDWDGDGEYTKDDSIPGEDGDTYEYYKYINPNNDSEHDGTYDWNEFVSYNSGNGGTGTFSDKMYFSHADSNAYNAYIDERWGENAPFDATYSSTEIRSKYIIRASVNHHDWYGAISTFKYDDLMPNVNLTAGIDIRSYAGEHYREVVNLLGGDYFIDIYGNVNDDTNDKKMKRIGDKIAYHNIGYNRWMGGFVQAEYAVNKLSSFLSVAGSNSTYQREDFHNYSGAEQLSEKADYTGYAFKLGANYNINSQMNVFANAGLLSTAPNFNSVYLNYGNTVNPKAKNENILNFEFGLGYTESGLNVNINGYNTEWADKQLVVTSGDNIYNIEGVKAVHQGLEIEGSIALLDNALLLNTAVSVGNWNWVGNVTGTVTDDYNRGGDTYTVNIMADGLPVGDAPQTQIVAGALYRIAGLTINPVFRFNDNHYANYDPSGVSSAGKEVFKIDSYSLIDVHMAYGLNIGIPLNIGFHLLNAMDETYFGDYVDGKGGFHGLGRRFNLSLGVSL
jgi:iron complex outermembrane receptor protein